MDFIAYDAALGPVWVPAGNTAKLVVARLGADGSLTTVRTVTTVPGARNAVSTERGVAY